MASYGNDETDLRAIVLAPYPIGTVPNQRFRFEQQIDRLEPLGIRLEVSSFLPIEIMPTLHRPGVYARKARAVLRGGLRRVRDLLRSGHYDVALISREAAPLGYPLIERLLPRLGLPYVFDFDDAIYIPNVSKANRLLAPLKFAGKVPLVARHASLVVAGNEHLAAWARAHNERVTTIPTTIDLSSYRPPAGLSPNGRPVCIGWSGSLTTVRYLDPLAPVLGELQREHGVRLRVIGDESYCIPGTEVEALPWRERTEVEDLSQIDIGIMPLPDDEWARGKCGLKALQYMALSIPTVMSPVGVNTKIAEGDAARLATSPEQWRSTLAALVSDATLREALGRRGRERVERDYSADAVAPRWAEALRSVSRARRRA